MLEGKNCGHAAVDRIGESSLRFVADGQHSIATSWRRNVQQQLGHIAGPKNLVHSGKLGSPLLGTEVRRKNATSHTLPAEELASAARRSTAHGRVISTSPTATRCSCCVSTTGIFLRSCAPSLRRAPRCLLQRPLSVGASVGAWLSTTTRAVQIIVCSCAVRCSRSSLRLLNPILDLL